MAREIVKKLENMTLFADGTILIKRVRVSYPHLFRPYSMPGQPGQPAYSMTGILAKADHAATKTALDEVVNRMIADSKLGRLPAEKLFIRDGDLAAKDEYEGAWTVSARDTRNKPVVVGPNRAPLADDSPLVYAGAWCNFHINPWVQNHQSYGKRVNANLLAVQFTGGGDPIGGGTIRRDELVEDYETTASDDDVPF